MIYYNMALETLSAVGNAILVILIVTSLGNQNANTSHDDPHMAVYPYLTDGIQHIHGGSITCIHDINNASCPAFGIKIESESSQNYYVNVDHRVRSSKDSESLRIAGTATNSRGYGRMPLFPGCRYSCVASPNSPNYDERYFGIIFNKIRADSVSFDVYLDIKE